MTPWPLHLRPVGRSSTGCRASAACPCGPTQVVGLDTPSIVAWVHAGAAELRPHDSNVSRGRSSPFSRSLAVQRDHDATMRPQRPCGVVVPEAAFPASEPTSGGNR